MCVHKRSEETGMAKITFFRQARADGGIRMGLDLDGQCVAHHFEPGSDENDPRLIWFVDLRCQGRQLPRSAETAIQWLRGKASMIKAAFAELAHTLELGVDDYIPQEHVLKGAPKGVRMAIVYYSARRVAARQIRRHVRETGERW